MFYVVAVKYRGEGSVLMICNSLQGMVIAYWKNRSDVQSGEAGDAGEAEPHLSYSNVTEKQLKKN